jgi:hypothetical protein
MQKAQASLWLAIVLYLRHQRSKPPRDAKEMLCHRQFSISHKLYIYSIGPISANVFYFFWMINLFIAWIILKMIRKIMIKKQVIQRVNL